MTKHKEEEQAPAPTKANAQRPSLGRIVSYTVPASPGIERHAVAGVVSDVSKGTVSLYLFGGPRDPRYIEDALHTDAPAGSEEAEGAWSWPERV